ncbi:YbaK/EbsC family protein [Desulfotruncus alcoholivorax]|uniref:YbaK/EbsC family protein n=1 Tax=Desulfotruncus alcoholivorax TaxID=265477 RepID=UPI0004237413|nr:YbaK/EbsC family protein [Desulfotruncus alcoholivorax]
MIDRVREYVQSYDPSIEPIVFKEKTGTVEEAARVLGVEPGKIAKSILFRSGDKYGLFVVAGDRRIDQKKVKTLLGSKPKMASSTEVEAVTGYKVGGVCPFNLLQDIPVYLDETMQRFNVVYTAAGSANSLLPISLEKLMEITGGSLVDVSMS